MNIVNKEQEKKLPEIRRKKGWERIARSLMRINCGLNFYVGKYNRIKNHFGDIINGYSFIQNNDLSFTSNT